MTAGILKMQIGKMLEWKMQGWNMCGGIFLTLRLSRTLEAKQTRFYKGVQVSTARKDIMTPPLSSSYTIMQH